VIRLFIAIAAVFVLTACQPPRQETQPLPTLFPSPTPPNFTLDEAERTASAFLYAWESSDFGSMHSLLSYLTRDATPLSEFTAFYEDAAETMTLNRVVVQPRAITRDPTTPRVAVMTYDMTFETELVGSFDDTGRELTLVFDERDGNWRVAWSPADLFREMGDGARLRLVTSQVNRANIYDRNGIVLAMQDERLIVTVNVVRRGITDEEACLNTLANATNLPVEVLLARLNNTPPDWVNEIAIIEPQAYTENVTALEERCNATFGNKSARRYPNGSLMPQILGSVGYVDPENVAAIVAEGFPQDSILGRNGIEQSWDRVLRGKPKAELALELNNGTRVKLLTSRPSEEAQAVWLTVDTSLQQRVLEMISQAYADNAETWGKVSRGAAAIVLDVETGEILAMVSYPTYDGNAFTPYPAMGRQAALDIIEKTGTDPRLPLLNRPTQGRYPSGSTMKIAISLAVADSGVYTTRSTWSCSGSWTRNDITRTDWLASGHGTLDLAGAITNSCNPYYYEAGYQMNQRDPFLMPTMLREYGFGAPTGMTDIAEDTGSIGDPDTYRIKTGLEWSFVDAVSMAIGQGEVEVTPLQMVRLTAAVANGGDLLKPFIVQKAGLFDDFSYEAAREVLGNLNVDQQVLDTVREGMCEVTTGYSGTATHIFVDSPLLNLGVCGKTGTAQNLPRGTTHAWFTAYAPKDEPEIAVVVIVEDAGEGSAVAAPLVRDIMEYYFFGES
jgi:penicillin-binding protein 2